MELETVFVARGHIFQYRIDISHYVFTEMEQCLDLLET